MIWLHKEKQNMEGKATGNVGEGRNQTFSVQFKRGYNIHVVSWTSKKDFLNVFGAES